MANIYPLLDSRGFSRRLCRPTDSRTPWPASATTCVFVFRTLKLSGYPPYALEQQLQANMRTRCFYNGKHANILLLPAGVFHEDRSCVAKFSQGF